MKVASKILALLSITALLLVMGAWTKTEVDHVDAPLTTPAQHPSSCHAHGGDNLPESFPTNSPLSFPRQAPVSYQCCLAGHVAALVQASDSSQPSAQYVGVILQIEAARTVSFLTRPESSGVLFANPLGTTTLRI
jgi:hypothetical protein